MITQAVADAANEAIGTFDGTAGTRRAHSRETISFDSGFPISAFACGVRTVGL